MSHPARPSASRANARPDDGSATPSPTVPPPAVDHAASAHGASPEEEARSPDEYLETPGSHRRPDGAATDVGA